MTHKFIEPKLIRQYKITEVQYTYMLHIFEYFYIGHKQSLDLVLIFQWFDCLERRYLDCQVIKVRQNPEIAAARENCS